MCIRDRKKYGLEKTILICGGDTKNQDLKPLLNIPGYLVKKAFIFGKDKDIMFQNMNDKSDTKLVENMQEAMRLASSQASPGDVILLSPAAASTDMYIDYKARGEEFVYLASLISNK